MDQKKKFGGNVQNSKIMHGMQLLVVELELLQQQVVHFVVGIKKYNFAFEYSDRNFRNPEIIHTCEGLWMLLFKLCPVL